MIRGKQTYGDIMERSWPGRNGVLRVGSYCSIGQNVTAYLGGEHTPGFVTTFPFAERCPARTSLPQQTRTNGDILIGNDVWIADNVVLMSGCRVGDGAVIGNSSVVRGRIRPYAIAMGNPCVTVGYRFSPETVSELLKIRWWEWDDERVAMAARDLLSADIGAFVKKYGK